MKSNCWERVVFDTPSLYCGTDILLTEAINSVVQKVWSNPKSTHNNHCPDDPGWFGMSVTDVGEPMDGCGGEKLIHLPPEAPHIELWWFAVHSVPECGFEVLKT